VADGPVDVPVCALHTTMATERPLTERAVLLVAALALLAGVAGSAWVATSASTPDRPQFDDDVADRYDAIQGVEGNRTTTIERNGTVESTRTYAVQMRPGTGEKTSRCAKAREHVRHAGVERLRAVALRARDPT